MARLWQKRELEICGLTNNVEIMIKYLKLIRKLIASKSVFLTELRLDLKIFY